MNVDEALIRLGESTSEAVAGILQMFAGDAAQPGPGPVDRDLVGEQRDAAARLAVEADDVAGLESEDVLDRQVRVGHLGAHGDLDAAQRGVDGLAGVLVLAGRAGAVALREGGGDGRDGAERDEQGQRRAENTTDGVHTDLPCCSCTRDASRSYARVAGNTSEYSSGTRA